MDSPSRVMTIYGQMNLQDPVMGFGFFFFSTPIHLFTKIRGSALLYTVF